MSRRSPHDASSLIAKALALLHEPATTAISGPRGAADGGRLDVALSRTEAAIRATSCGDAGSYIALWDDRADVSLFGAWGTTARGPAALRSAFESLAQRYGPEGGLSCELTAIHVGQSLACTVGFERGVVQIDGRAPAPMTIRVTHLYRHTGGHWRLIHRHADFPPDSASRLHSAPPFHAGPALESTAHSSEASPASASS